MSKLNKLKSLTRDQLRLIKKRSDALEQIEALKKAGPYPPDPDGQNDNRSNWAEVALMEFMVVTGTDAETAVRDLLSDLKHWCDRHEVVFDQELEIGMEYYREETLPDDTEST